MELPVYCRDLLQNWRADALAGSPDVKQGAGSIRPQRRTAIGLSVTLGLAAALVVGAALWQKFSLLNRKEANPGTASPMSNTSSDSTTSAFAPADGNGWDDVSRELEQLRMDADESFPKMEQFWW